MVNTLEEEHCTNTSRKSSDTTINPSRKLPSDRKNVLTPRKSCLSVNTDLKSTSNYPVKTTRTSFSNSHIYHKQGPPMHGKSLDKNNNTNEGRGLPTDVMHQLSSHARFEQMRTRSTEITEQSTDLDDLNRQFKDSVKIDKCKDVEDGGNLFNPEFTFEKKSEVKNIGRSLIESIRMKVKMFVAKEEDSTDVENSDDWDSNTSSDHLPNIAPPTLPRETRHAAIGIQLATSLAAMKNNFAKPSPSCAYCQHQNQKQQQQHQQLQQDNQEEHLQDNQHQKLEQHQDGHALLKHLDQLQNSATQTTPSPSRCRIKTVMMDTLKNYERIPCPRNLLCEQGLHAGKCQKTVRSKLATAICQDTGCICKRREENEEEEDLSAMFWPGRAERVTTVIAEDLTNEETVEDIDNLISEEYSTSTISTDVSTTELPSDLCNEDNKSENQEDKTDIAEIETDPLESTNDSSAPISTSSKMNGMNGHTNGDLNGCGDIITQNQQKGCWTIGLINSKFRYLTAETFGFKINANGASLKKKQIWTLEPVSNNGTDSLIYLRSHLDKYLAVDSFGNVMCESDEKEPGSKFQISVADDGSGRWALKNVVRGYFLGSSSDKLTCTAKVPGDAEFWHVHLAARPQVNLRSVGRKRFAHLSENLDEIHVDANIPWGEDTLFTLEFRLDESGKYAIHTCNNKYLSLGGKLVEQCNKDCLFSAEYHSGQLALRDRSGAYLSPIGSKAVLKTRSNTVTRDELFSLEDSLPQASFVANLNARFVSVKQGVDVTANQDEISDHETFQLEFDWSTKRWYIRTMQDRYWTLETGGGIQASGDKRSSNALFDLAWQKDGSVAFRANNGRFVITKRSGHLYATGETVDDNAKYYFYLVNRPQLVLKCEQGFVGYKAGNGGGGKLLECNRATYECIQVERGDKGVVYFKGQNGKYWHCDSEGISADSDTQEGFHLELREPTRLCIKSTAGNYLTASKNGLFRLGDTAVETATQWEY